LTTAIRLFHTFYDRPHFVESSENGRSINEVSRYRAHVSRALALRAAPLRFTVTLTHSTQPLPSSPALVWAAGPDKAFRPRKVPGQTSGPQGMQSPRIRREVRANKSEG